MLMSTPRRASRAPMLKPAAANPLNKASRSVLPTPSTSPVDFISGPSALLASGNFWKENTGTFTVKYGGALCRPDP